MELLNTIS